jgi:hypothetical protein
MGDRIHRTPLSVLPQRAAYALSLLLGLACADCGSDDSPETSADVDAGGINDANTGAIDILAVDPVTIRAGEQLQVRVTADNPESLPLTWNALMPDLPAVSSTWDIAGTADGALFQWTPLPSHVGEHVINIEATAGDLTVSEVLRVSVTTGVGGAPRFEAGNQGLLVDLSLTSCAETRLQATDPDSDAVAFSAGENAPVGLSVSRVGPLEMRLSWCPSQAQLDRSLRWTFDINADDGAAVTTLSYTIVFRRPQREGCSGEPPEIRIVSPAKGAELASTDGYEVLIEASDTEGLRQAPVLFWTPDPVADESSPQLSDFQVSNCSAVSGTAGQFVCVVPDQGLSTGEQRVINALASVTDNDDESGSACDQTSDTDLTRFVALPAATEPPPLRDLCAPCSASSQCGSGVCAVGGDGGLACLRACDSDCGACSERRTASAELVRTCDSSCGEIASCMDDENEPDDTVDTATIALTDSITAQLCPDDQDLHALEVRADERTQVTLTIAPGGGDLDLGLSTLDGDPIGVSAGTNNTETVTFCPTPAVGADGFVIAEVFGFESASGAYELRVTRGGGDCCIDDPLEENDTVALAIILESSDVVDATICPDDNDFFEIELTEPGTLRALLVFESDLIDLDMDLIDSSGRIVDSAATLSDEELRVPLTAGRWALRVYGFDGDAGGYLLEVEAEPLDPCVTDDDCAAGDACRAIRGGSGSACGTRP